MTTVYESSIDQSITDVLAVLRTYADEVDRDARFPTESVDALRDAGLLGVGIPREFGGGGATLTDIARISRALGAECASTAMIFVMHQSQVLSIVRHGKSDAMADLQRRIVTDRILVASATTEINIGGDVRSSSCAVEYDGEQITLSKNAPVISYGEYAQIVLATARRSVDSPPSDQVLVVCEKPDVTLVKTGTWDTLGFRGTCSPGFMLDARTTTSNILGDNYGDISAQTMLPVAHVLWGSAWLGIADAAVTKARKSVQKAARKTPGTPPPSALRLAELMVVHEQLVDTVFGAAAKFEAVSDSPAELGAIGFALKINNVKVTASTLVIDIVGKALQICGISGYRQDGEMSIGRHLRDAHGSAIMVSNERILGHNSQLSLVYKGK
ncbi:MULTISPECIES: acyl-CoA dehydrogenase family protein [Rhodococcus]|jgi:acyl-CoA dehydrogenase|uniref:Acyl-CoA dehydrogenase family protein n=1 Tax=Rhodococcus cercidiphylli TaxID=489916 RepID=A0ABU4AW42_9NOCA|nr:MULTISPECIES: acyl-CoA dehydrogenase family protein [Rhodococcus]KAA0923472.1 acyl-CoA dehydrogenase [Rhodococcus sp. ANT_H53B]MDI6629490.1 acyl-CoA dehydrogenase family protein [Rhodococcus sp. (in: high G+C Gram-positive bacteria)]MDI9927130.1 acyl-CoA dehydrogenase family protein [Rhodococcus sp. IEGM 1341]MDV6230457.1 acyl-CoA dehydrogenase family protein [Rhodococcus cercidiphylli]MDV8056342.1 acyl-CoA dehydrogenase family protein [Rhodococcus sp. IEGM 1343]